MSKQERSNKARASATVSSKLNKNLATYMAAAGAAGVSMLALTPKAEAKVIYTSTYVQLGGNYFPDINHDGVYDFAFRPYGFCISERVGSLCGASVNLNLSSYTKGKFMGSANGFASALHAGDKIGPPGQFEARQVIAVNFYQFFSGTINPPNWFGPFANGGKGVRDRYIGLKFNIGPEAHYGWMRISVQIPNAQKNGYSAIVTGYAYETEPNTAIIAGQKTSADEKSALSPTPLNPAQSVSLGMLARGADALSMWRREEVSATN
jgi:hypothetical protein